MINTHFDIFNLQIKICLEQTIHDPQRPHRRRSFPAKIQKRDGFATKKHVECIYGQVVTGHGENNSGLWPTGGNNSIVETNSFANGVIKYVRDNRSRSFAMFFPEIACNSDFS